MSYPLISLRYCPVTTTNMESSGKPKCSFLVQLFLYFNFMGSIPVERPCFLFFFFFEIAVELQSKRANLFFMSSVCFADLCVSLCAQRLPYGHTCHKKNYVSTVLTSTDTPRSKVSDWFRKISGSVDGIQIFFLLI